MPAKFRYLETGSHDPYYNLAFEEYVLTEMPDAESGRSRGNDHRSGGEEPLQCGAAKEPGLHRTTAGNAADRFDSEENTGDPGTDRIYLRVVGERKQG